MSNLNLYNRMAWRSKAGACLKLTPIIIRLRELKFKYLSKCNPWRCIRFIRWHGRDKGFDQPDSFLYMPLLDVSTCGLKRGHMLGWLRGRMFMGNPDVQYLTWHGASGSFDNSRFTWPTLWLSGRWDTLSNTQIRPSKHHFDDLVCFLHIAVQCLCLALVSTCRSLCLGFPICSVGLAWPLYIELTLFQETSPIRYGSGQLT